MKEFDEKSQRYVGEMTKHHSSALIKYQQDLQEEMRSKPPKWSRDLLEWRKRQHILAKQKNYAEAQKIKTISDALENEERGSMNANHAGSFAKKEANYRQQQIAEMQATEKRIDVRRKEHLQQRNLDCKRLLQRNQNIQAAMVSKQVKELVTFLQQSRSYAFIFLQQILLFPFMQALECSQLFADLRKNLRKSRLP